MLNSPALEETESDRVLLVEDDGDLRASLFELLCDEGYEIATAANGLEALEQLRGPWRPAVIVLDLLMPVMDGWQFRTVQMADPDLNRIPVILLSAVVDRGIADLLQPDAHLLKPFVVDRLLELLAETASRPRPSSDCLELAPVEREAGYDIARVVERSRRRGARGGRRS
jgi:CheY-like chemotaxis protein